MIMRSFRSFFPDIAIRPFCASPKELNQRLKNGTIDIAFSITHNLSDEELTGFSTKQIMRDSLCFVLPEGQSIPTCYSLTESPPLVIWGDPIIPGYFSYVTDCLKRLKLRVPKVIFTDSLPDLRVYLESGYGFSILAKKYSEIFNGSMQFIPIEDTYLEFGFLWNDSSSNPALPLFLDSLDQFLNPTSE